MIWTIFIVYWVKSHIGRICCQRCLNWLTSSLLSQFVDVVIVRICQIWGCAICDRINYWSHVDKGDAPLLICSQSTVDCVSILTSLSMSEKHNFLPFVQVIDHKVDMLINVVVGQLIKQWAIGTQHEIVYQILIVLHIHGCWYSGAWACVVKH